MAFTFLPSALAEMSGPDELHLKLEGRLAFDAGLGAGLEVGLVVGLVVGCTGAAVGLGEAPSAATVMLAEPLLW